jgi:beta-aspartyl-peptidase (threonine type)
VTVSSASASVANLPPLPWRAAAVAHGGAGSDPAHSDGCRSAVDVALASLRATNDPLAAAVAGVVVLEDDVRFNAGTGSVVRLDGSIQMDASVMTSDGGFGAIAGIERVKNPVLVARAVRETPHLLLAGDGATRFARTLGHAEHDPSTPARVAAMEELKARLGGADPTLPAFWRGDDWRQRWNYALSPAQLGIDRARQLRGSDTVGLVVRTADGRFAAALSTGGTAVMLRGRVGDVPLLGAGLFAGPHGAAAATGTGERITEVLLARTAFGWIEAGDDAATVATRGVDLIKHRGDVGLIVVTQTTLAAAAGGPMAWAGREDGASW